MKTIRKFVMFALVAMVANASWGALTLRDAVLPQNKKGIGRIVPAADGESYYQLNSNGSAIEKVSYKTGAKKVVFDSKEARDCPVNHWDGFSFSEDEGKILLHTNSKYIYRRSFSADYYVYEIYHNKLTKLTQAGGERIATISPNGRMVAFVKDNNVYLKKLDFNTEIAVTTDGKVNSVINGATDWVYEEEFRLTNSITWSPDNSTFAFLRFDETDVRMWQFQIFGGQCNADSKYKLYPGLYEYKYPVAGEVNSKVTVQSYDVDNRVIKTMKVPMASDDYIPYIVFGPTADRLMVFKLNRNQNEATIYAVNPRSTVAKSVYTEKSKTWIDIDLFNQTKFYNDHFIVMSDRSGYTHLYQYTNAGALSKQITNGEWNVTEYYGYNETLKTYYFQSTITSPLDRTITKLDAKGVVSAVVKEPGTFSASFSKNMAYYVQTFSDAKTPEQYKVCSAAGKALRNLELNSEYAAKFTGADVPQREFFKFTTGDGITLNGYMIKPLDFNASKKYPVIMAQYSGPGSQYVLNKWKLDWEAYFATQGFIVVAVDGRGTGGRGKAFESIVYMNLGYYESIDQIAAANYMASQPYVDAKNIGIYGWSFGGYEVLMAMSQDNSPYKAGVAIAPVTDWRFYDTIYTERYMRTPQENDEGYSKSAPINRVEKLKGHLLMMHGTADDNVHVTNAYEYSSKMASSNKLFDLMIYPNMNHSINGCETRVPLYMKVLDFYNTNLK